MPDFLVIVIRFTKLTLFYGACDIAGFDTTRDKRSHRPRWRPPPVGLGRKERCLQMVVSESSFSTDETQIEAR